MSRQFLAVYLFTFILDTAEIEGYRLMTAAAQEGPPGAEGRITLWLSLAILHLSLGWWRPPGSQQGLGVAACVLARWGVWSQTSRADVLLKVTESKTNLDWKGPQKSSSSNHPAMGSNILPLTRLLTAPYKLPGMGPPIASLGNLFQCLTTVKSFSLISDIDLPFLSLKPFSYHWMPL